MIFPFETVRLESAYHDVFENYIRR